jgi:hypothetical protein
MPRISKAQMEENERLAAESRKQQRLDKIAETYTFLTSLAARRTLWVSELDWFSNNEHEDIPRRSIWEWRQFTEDLEKFRRNAEHLRDRVKRAAMDLLVHGSSWSGVAQRAVELEVEIATLQVRRRLFDNELNKLGVVVLDFYHVPKLTGEEREKFLAELAEIKEGAALLVLAHKNGNIEDGTLFTTQDMLEANFWKTIQARVAYPEVD